MSSTPSKKKGKAARSEDLEVTGVSRSGRIRKKSSLLTDFESPDEVDPKQRQRRKSEKDFDSPTRTPKKGQKKEKSQNISLPPPSDDDDLPDESFADLSDIGSDMSDGDIEDIDDEDDDDDEQIDNMALDVDEDMDGESSSHMVDGKSHVPGFTQAQSTYMLEKSSKRGIIVKDGKIVGKQKAPRKDKGKTRFTAYMLWAKGMRQELLKNVPDYAKDFSALNKRLGELWSLTPKADKYLWKRKAFRMKAKGAAVSSTGMINTGKMKSTGARSTLLNKSGVKSAPRSTGNVFDNIKPIQSKASVIHQPMSRMVPITSSRSQGKGTPSKAGPVLAEPLVGAGLYKVVGSEPIDIAAHLSLLGESLSIIGERLQEHEGQIAVSGSLSVLLDSILCAMGPLLCLTQQVPELNTAVSQETYAKILNNIAYFMPGL